MIVFYHNYSELILRNLWDQIQSRIFFGRIESLGIFNMKNIQESMNLVSRSSIKNNDYLERLTWLVSLDYLIEKYNIEITRDYSKSIMDFINERFLLGTKFSLMQIYRYLNTKVI